MNAMRCARLAVTVACAALASSCSNATSPLSNELSVQRHRWDSAKVRDYQFTYRALCFCAITDSVRVLVIADTVQSATVISSGQQLDRTFVPTVVGLFKIIDDALVAKRDVHATYDSQYGFPTQIELPGRPGFADDGATYIIRDFHVATLILHP